MLVPVPLDKVKIPTKATTYTDLADLTPLPTSALQEPKYEQLYTKYDTFNPIQTQLFHVLYHTDTPCLVGAPTGSGKTTIAELALLVSYDPAIDEWALIHGFAPSTACFPLNLFSPIPFPFVCLFVRLFVRSFMDDCLLSFFCCSG